MYASLTLWVAEYEQSQRSRAAASKHLYHRNRMNLNPKMQGVNTYVAMSMGHYPAASRCPGLHGPALPKAPV